MASSNETPTTPSGFVKRNAPVRGVLSLSRLSCTCIQGLAHRALWHKRWRLRCLLALEARQAEIGITLNGTFHRMMGWRVSLVSAHLLSCAGSHRMLLLDSGVVVFEDGVHWCHHVP
jgi:hypothetical protein